MEKPLILRNGEYQNPGCPPVFRIKNKWGSSGSGFLINGGKILTVAHNIVKKQTDGSFIADAEPEIFNCFSDDFNGKLLNYDTKLDLALIDMGAQLEGMEPLRPCDAKTFPVGSPVDIYGFPSGYQSDFPCYMSGSISGAVNSDGGKKMYINAPYNLGFSGGPILCSNTSTYLGLVTSKPNPWSPHSSETLRKLYNEKRGIKMEIGDEKVSASKAIAEVFADFASRRNMGFGYSPTIEQIENFVNPSS